MSGIHLTPKPFGFIQARSTSTRFAGKIFQCIPEKNGFSLLEHIHNRLNTILPKEQIVFLIPDSDKLLADYLDSKKFNYYSGSMDDVRHRYIAAANHFGARDIIRLTGDNPFIDITSIELLWEAMFHLKTRYYCLAMEGLPLGMGVECFSYESLVKNIEKSCEPRHLEHVSLHIKEDLSLNTVIRLIPPHLNDFEIMTAPDIRMTVDEEDDITVLRNVWLSLNEKSPYFGTGEVIRLFIDKPAIFDGNRPVKQVRFDLPKNKKFKKKISLTYGDPLKFGTGHFERTKSLSIELQMSEHLVFTNPIINNDFDAFIVDARETLPKGKPALLIDHIEIDQDKLNKYVFFLPHPNIGKKFGETIPFYSSPLLESYKNDKIEIGSWVLYAGNLSESDCDAIDDYLLNVLTKHWEINKVTRIGGTISKHSTINYFRRLNKREYYEIISTCEGFISYFGQSIMESLFLQKKTALFGMTEIHKKLGLFFSEMMDIDYLGEPGAWQNPEKKTGDPRYRLTRDAQIEILQWLEQI